MDIQIRLLNDYEYSNSRLLWDVCFPYDGTGFINWYYSFRSCPEYVLGAFYGDTIVAMLHMIPMDIMFKECVQTVCFISGVCTHPNYRNMGICSMLFRNAIPIMRQRGFNTSMLQPFDTLFYEKYGYHTFIQRNRVRLSGGIIKLHNCVNAIQPSPKLLLKQYSDFMSGYYSYSVRDENYFEGMIEEYGTPDGRLICNAYGYCAGYMNDGVFDATELVMPMQKGVKVDICQIACLLPKDCELALFPLPCDVLPPDECKSNTEDFSMISLLDVENTHIYHTAASKADNNISYGFDRY